MGLKEIIGELKEEKECEKWNLVNSVENIFQFKRLKEGVCEARVYIDQEKKELGSLGCAYIILNPINKKIEGREREHFNDFTKLKKYILKIIKSINSKYFK